MPDLADSALTAHCLAPARRPAAAGNSVTDRPFSARHLLEDRMALIDMSYLSNVES